MSADQRNTVSKLIFATNNAHKVAEIRVALGGSIEVVSLQEAGIFIDIPEPHDTLEANATEKSRTIYQLTGTACFSEDTGLETTALNGEPGVLSARYAGNDSNAKKNVEKLLLKLAGKTDRSARFRTVISLLMDEQEYLFEGICEGEIGGQPCGNMGFGYDPVFVPTGAGKTFAEMNMEEKNAFSHRKKAADKLIGFLKLNSPSQR